MFVNGAIQRHEVDQRLRANLFELPEQAAIEGQSLLQRKDKLKAKTETYFPLHSFGSF